MDSPPATIACVPTVYSVVHPAGWLRCDGARFLYGIRSARDEAARLSPSLITGSHHEDSID
ncbi:MAG: hypothetical protein ACLGHE_07515 [Gammaproteobacteria bacterium]